MSKFINIIINPVGNKCNLKCEYCYTKNRKTEENRIPAKNIFKLINFLNSVKDIKNINFTWHGGEPLLMGKGYFEKILKYQENNLKNISYNNIIQTNGLLLDD